MSQVQHCWQDRLKLNMANKTATKTAPVGLLHIANKLIIAKLDHHKLNIPS